MFLFINSLKQPYYSQLSFPGGKVQLENTQIISYLLIIFLKFILIIWPEWGNFSYLLNSMNPVPIVQFSSVTQSCPTLCDPMNRSMPGLPVHHQLPEFTQIHVHRVGDAISHLILGRPLLLLPPIPPSIRVFSNESTLHVRCPKYWSFSFSIIPSKEIPGLISFRMD